MIFLREHLFEFDLDVYRPLGDPTRFLAALATLFSRCKDEDIAPADYLAHADRVAAEAAALAEAAAGAEPGAADGTPMRRCRAEEAARGRPSSPAPTRRYQALLAANGCIDFGDQVALALRLVRDVGRRRGRAIAGRFRYILVDEFQDTNRAQAELVAALAEAHRNVTVVGDDDQAIYAFRGAAVDNILDFQRPLRGRPDRRPATELPLARADPRRRLPARSGSTTRTGSRSGPGSSSGCAPSASRRRAAPVRLEAFATGAEEADWIAAEIGRRIAAGAAPRDHAVLVRANGHADPILRALNMAGIPWRFSGTSGLYARPEVRLLLAFLRVVADLESSVDLYALAASDVYGLGGEDLTAIVNMARRRNRSVWAILEELDRQPGHPARRARRRGRPSIELVDGPARLRRGRPRAAGRRAPVPLPARQRHARPARRRRTRRRPRSSSRTSPASSRSSGRSRRCSPTTGRSSSRRTSRRSSRPATTRRRPSSTPMPTRSRS